MDYSQRLGENPLFTMLLSDLIRVEAKDWHWEGGVRKEDFRALDPKPLGRQVENQPESTSTVTETWNF